MLVAPIILLLPVAALALLLVPEIARELPDPIREMFGIACGVIFRFAPTAFVFLPTITLLSGAFSYEAWKDWIRLGKTGGSLGLAALWAAPALIYGAIFLLSITSLILG